MLAAGGDAGEGRVLRRRQDPRRDAPRAGGRRALLQRRERGRAASCCRKWPSRAGRTRAGQPARQPRRRRQDPPLHLHRPEGQQVRHRARPRRWHAYRRAAALPGLEVVGIDCHIGSQITESAPYLDALDRVLDLVEAIEADGIAHPPPRPRRRAGHHLHRRDSRRTPKTWSRGLLERIDARGHGQREARVRAGPLAGRQRRRAADRGARTSSRARQELLHRRRRDERPGAPGDVRRLDGHRAVRRAAGDAAACTTWSARCANRATGSAATARSPCEPGDLLAVLSAGAYGMSDGQQLQQPAARRRGDGRRRPGVPGPRARDAPPT